MTGEPCILVLAAGQGSRYRAQATPSSDKLMARCRGLDGVERGVLEQVLGNLATTTARKILVSLPGKPAVEALAGQHGFELLSVNSTGMGHSLAAAATASAEQSGWLVVLGDMPFIQPQTYQAVLASLRSDRISVACGPAGQGHPVAFGAHFGAALRALAGDAGGRKLMTADNLLPVHVAEGGIYRDVDVPADLVHTAR